MDSVFLSQSFKESDRALLSAIMAVVEAAGLRIVTGDALGGGAVSDGVRRLIQASDACVVVATAATKAKGSSTHPWVQSELTMAKTLEKPCIALVGKGVRLKGAFSEEERVEYDPSHPLAAVTKLARTISAWRREAGRQVRVVPLPADVADMLGSRASEAVCEYRFYDEHGRDTAWRRARVVPQQGAPVVHLNGASDDWLIEIRLAIGGQRWFTKAVPPFTHVTFQKEVAL